MSGAGKCHRTAERRADAGGFVTPGLYPKALRGASGTEGDEFITQFLAQIAELGVPFGLAEYYLP